MAGICDFVWLQFDTIEQNYEIKYLSNEYNKQSTVTVFAFKSIAAKYRICCYIWYTYLFYSILNAYVKNSYAWDKSSCTRQVNKFYMKYTEEKSIKL